MLHFLPAPVLGALSLAAFVLNTIFWTIPLLVVTVAKLLLPFPPVRRQLSDVLVNIAMGWIWGNNTMLRLAQRIEWTVTGIEDLHPQSWYLIFCNHQSLVDIPVLQRIFFTRTPFIRFFIKRELLWVPLLGMAWWALDFPFMKRHSRAYLERNPEKRGEDLATARRACERFRDTPTAILNFVEGTRFTPEKHVAQQSPYQHLLLPKAGGLAQVLAAMGDMFAAMLNVTIVYPDGPAGFWDLFSGRVRRVIVHVEQCPIPCELLAGDYTNDPEFRARFQAWVQQLWREKDVRIVELMRGQ